MKQQNKADLKLSYDTNHGEWRMAKDGGMAHGPSDYPTLKVDYDYDGQFIFKIQHPQGVKFANNDAFVPKAGKTNPSDFAQQFTVDGQGTDTLTVNVANANKQGGSYDGGNYNFELHFAGKPALDPIITNGGCCHTVTHNYLAFYALGAVALIALFVLVFRPMLARRSSDSLKDRDPG